MSPTTLHLDKVTVEDFAPLVGHEFPTSLEQGGPKVVTLVLKEAKELGAAVQDRRAPFNLVFDGPADTPLQQQILWLSHPDLKEFGIFMVPIGIENKVMRYQAVFN